MIGRRNVELFASVVLVILVSSGCQTTLEKQSHLQLGRQGMDSWNIKYNKKSEHYGTRQTAIATDYSGARAELYYWQAFSDLGVWVGNTNINKEQIQKFNRFKNKVLRIEPSLTYMAKVGEIPYVKVTTYNSERVFLLAPLTQSMNDRFSRPDKVLMGYYCEKPNTKLSNKKIFTFFDDIHFKTAPVSAAIEAQSRSDISADIPANQLKSKRALSKAKSECKELGFQEATEKYGECVLKLYKTPYFSD